MAHAYAHFDWEVADYQIFLLDPELKDRQTGEGLLIRGPRPQNLKDGEYFVCIGAAQTFGRFCEKPYPSLLRESLNLEVLNLGRGGAGPSFFSEDNSVLLNYTNRARFAVIQVMSGRSESNSEFHSNGLGFYTRVSDGSWIDCDEAFKELLQMNDKDRLRRIIAETRLNWISNYEKLLGGITVPKILLWFSTRAPHYPQGDDTIESLFGAFPQLVNASMMAHLKGICDHYVEVVTTRGYPHRLTSRFTGKPVIVVDDWGGKWSENWYYPSPEMHIDAAHKLERTVRKHLIPRSSGPLTRLRNTLSRRMRRSKRG